MSWQLVTLAIVLLVIGTGLIWYERSRPPAQVVALVALLAALAVVGRVLLAPLPNVVATTDIVLFAGYVLGPAPGFAVGALGGLVSNFWLGQGMWTPWQMVAWGMTGVAGGVLWRLTGGRANRAVLALACGAAAVAFGLWMNLQFLVGFGGEVSLSRYLALQVRSIPFDLAHVAGNVLFALIAGPAMVEALRRFKERFEWQRAPGAAGFLLVAVSLTVVLTAPPARADLPAPARDARAWLEARQNLDGGFPASPGNSSSVSMTARAAIGLAAANRNPLDVSRGGRSPIGFLGAEQRRIDDPNELALVILALEASGADGKAFAARNLVRELDRERRQDRTFGGRVNVAAFAALAFRAAGAGESAGPIVDWLRSVQGAGDSGWGISPTAAPDPDSTGTVLQLLSRGERSDRALDWLDGVQKPSGGFSGYSAVPTPNSQSTGLVLQGLDALGYGPGRLSRNGKDGLDFLRERQRTSGAIDYSATSDQTAVWVTADSLVALSGKSLPVSAPARQPVVPSDGQPGGSTGGGSTGGSSTGGSTGGGGSGSTGSGGQGSVPGEPLPGSGSGDGDGSTPVPAPDSPIDSVFDTVPEPPGPALLAASARGSDPSAPVAILIGLATTVLVVGSVVALVRRKGW